MRTIAILSATLRATRAPKEFSRRYLSAAKARASSGGGSCIGALFRSFSTSGYDTISSEIVTVTS